MKNLLKLLTVIAIGFAIYGVFKPLPDGVNIAGEKYNVPSSSISFYEDLTYINENEVRYSDQEIFDEVFRMIRGASNYILIDMFLFNDFLGSEAGSYRQLSGELTETLITKKQEMPDIDIVVITDPINIIYGGYESLQLKSLEEAGIEVVITDLSKLRDSNPIVSGFWRAYFSWFKNSTREGFLPNPFDVNIQKLGIRSYASLLNFKANHRKVIVADMPWGSGIKFSTLITSANPHDGSSAHSNTALRIDDFIWKDVINSEIAVANFSKTVISVPNEELQNRVVDTEGSVSVQLLTEQKIRDQIIETINSLDAEDTLDIAMFYLSERKIIGAIKDASNRKVKVRILMDPNKDAFGREKNGIPNRSVAYELNEHRKSIGLRWCHTHGEQCHTKMIITNKDGAYSLILGSANLTRRNIGGYNLETNVFIESAGVFPALSQAINYFEKVWNNEGGRIYSIEYSTYRDESYKNVLLYRLMEDLGTSSF